MMILAAVDDSNGMMFNKRRQSQDKILREYILTMARGKRLWMSDYTGKQFAAINQNINQAAIRIDNDFLDKAGPGEYCLIENHHVSAYLDQIERVILFKWNRAYPGDFFFDLDLSAPKWILKESEDFPGFSHEKITKEVYVHES